MRRSDKWTGEDGFQQALNRNAVAKAIVRNMDPSQREELRRRSLKVKSPEEMEAFVDGIVGWREGHPPYQL